MKLPRQLLATSYLFFVLASLLLTAQTSLAKSPSFYWEFINVQIDVQANGDMLVTETQKYIFTGSHSNERYRYILLEKIDGIDQIEVYEGDEKLPFTKNIKNNQQWIKWRHELNPPESHTFVLKYRMLGGIQIHDKEDWIYVKAIFKGRSAPINSGKVVVRLPGALAGKIIRLKKAGVPIEARKIDEQTVEFVAIGAMPPGKELKVGVVVPHGILKFEMPRWQQSYLAKQGKGNAVQEALQGSHRKGFGALIIFIIVLAFVAVFIAIFGNGGGRGGNNGSGNGETGYYPGGGGCGGGGGGCGGGCGGGG